MARDNRTEDFLTTQKVPWHYEMVVPLIDFDMKQSFQNQARPVPRIEWLMEKYRMMYLANPDPPAGIAYRDARSGKLVHIDGIHRYEGADAAKATTIDIYVADTLDFAVLDRITRQANIWLNAEGVGNDFPIEQAKRLHYGGGMTVEQAAKACLISSGRLDLALADDRANKVFGEMNEDPTGYPKEVRRGIAILPTKKGAQLAIDVYKTYRPSAEDMKSLISTLKPIRDEAKMVEAQVAWVESRPTLPGRQPLAGGPGLKPDKRLVTISRLPRVGYMVDLRRVVERARRFPTAQKMGFSGPTELAEYQGIMKELNQYAAKHFNTWGKRDDES